MQQVDVCIATYKRPKLLKATLESLLSQELQDISLRIIIIDNDKEETARSVIDDFQRVSPFKVVYDVEPRQNIALARNRGLTHINGQYVAFLDDDETASPKWVSYLLSALKKYDADVVFGPVQSVLPEDIPDWVKKAGFFKRAQRDTGTKMNHGGSGNVLCKVSALPIASSCFREEYGLTGGSDTEFFFRLSQSGRRLIWCSEAIVCEIIPPERISISWLRRRGFRGGQTFVRVFFLREPLLKQVNLAARKFGQIAACIAVLPFLRFISYEKYLKISVRLFSALGQLSVFARLPLYNEYRTPQ